MTAGDESATTITDARLRYEHPALFMNSLRDEQGRPLMVELHQREWLRLFRSHERLTLLAPRDHGKSTCVAAYLLWHAWRLNRHPDTGRLLDGQPEGSFEAVMWSATLDQAIHLYERIRALMLANEWLFLDILPDGGRTTRVAARDAWSRKRTRLRNGFEFSVRAFRTSTRGLHPDLIILDDVLSDANSLSSFQRNQTWRHFAGTIVPMNPKQLIVVGTAFHHDDLLHRLRPKPRPEATAQDHSTWAWQKYRALDAAEGVALWPARHPVEELLRRREFDPVAFAREFQNDPTDEASSLFPFSQTERMLDPTATFGRSDRTLPRRRGRRAGLRRGRFRRCGCGLLQPDGPGGRPPDTAPTVSLGLPSEGHGVRRAGPASPRHLPDLRRARRLRRTERLPAVAPCRAPEVPGDSGVHVRAQHGPREERLRSGHPFHELSA